MRAQRRGTAAEQRIKIAEVAEAAEEVAVGAEDVVNNNRLVNVTVKQLRVTISMEQQRRVVATGFIRHNNR